MPKTITAEEADSRYGEIVHVTEHFVVRVRQLTELSLQTVVHKRGPGGEELLPLGYTSGSNLIHTNKWPSEDQVLASSQYTRVRETAG